MAKSEPAMTQVPWVLSQCQSLSYQRVGDLGVGVCVFLVNFQASRIGSRIPDILLGLDPL